MRDNRFASQRFPTRGRRVRLGDRATLNQQCANFDFWYHSSESGDILSFLVDLLEFEIVGWEVAVHGDRQFEISASRRAAPISDKRLSISHLRSDELDDCRSFPPTCEGA